MCHKGKLPVTGSPCIFTFLDFDFFQDMFCVCVLLSQVRLFVTPWAVAHQDILSTEFSRQEYWSPLPFPDEDELGNGPF